MIYHLHYPHSALCRALLDPERIGLLATEMFSDCQCHTQTKHILIREALNLLYHTARGQLPEPKHVARAVSIVGNAHDKKDLCQQRFFFAIKDDNFKSSMELQSLDFIARMQFKEPNTWQKFTKLFHCKKNPTLIYVSMLCFPCKKQFRYAFSNTF